MIGDVARKRGRALSFRFRSVGNGGSLKFVMAEE